MDRKQFGMDAENTAENHLTRQGLTPLTRNFSCKAGEIDLIMQDEDTLVFVEVRLRHNTDYGSAAESVTLAKQRKIIRTARYFLLRYPALQDLPCRFDVVAFDGTEALSAPLWYKDAFRV